jgi:hypothetical protein
VTSHSLNLRPVAAHKNVVAHVTATACNSGLAVSQPLQAVQHGAPTGRVHGHGVLAASAGMRGAVMTRSSHVIDLDDSEGQDREDPGLQGCRPLDRDRRRAEVRRNRDILDTDRENT